MFAICVVAPPGDCLRVKADMELFAGSSVCSIAEGVRVVCIEALYKCQMYIYRAYLQKSLIR